MRATILLSAMLLAGCAMGDTGVRGAIPPGARYVAMGSSFGAGAGIGPTKPGTPARCQRTALNYATLLAARLRLALDDQTCGGATTAHILGPWNELPAQIDAVSADTRLVTITIGGNDLGYVAGLMGASCRAGAPIRPGPCFPNRAPAEADYAKVESQLREIARAVAGRAPNARLAFVQYLTLVPPAPCAAAALAADEVETSRAIGRRLAAITANVARETGALLIAADELSRGHTACDADPWSRGMAPGYKGEQGAPWHPTAAGHAAIAEELARRLEGR